MTKDEKVMMKREQEWQAESDAETMARYQEIMDDEARARRAVAKAKEKEKNLRQRADAMAVAANLKDKKKK